MLCECSNEEVYVCVCRNLGEQRHRHIMMGSLNDSGLTCRTCGQAYRCDCSTMELDEDHQMMVVDFRSWLVERSEVMELQGTQDTIASILEHLAQTRPRWG